MEPTPVSKTNITLADVLNTIHVYLGLVAIGIGAWALYGWALALLITGALSFSLGVFAIIWSTR